MLAVVLLALKWSVQEMILGWYECFDIPAFVVVEEEKVHCHLPNRTVATCHM
jgi:hypothetical protein|tara:strand:- start:313 stop:468 length:156 start_codon:yes stop_codon:yes gene_type:complete